jgi:methyl-accepting chemotaxis protein
MNGPVTGAAVLRRRARIRQLRAAVDQALAGDLGSVAIQPATNDDLGQLERGVAELVERLVSVVGTVRHGADRMRDARLAAADVHKQMLDAAEMTAGQAYDVGVTAADVAGGINAVASATDELNSTISDVANHATIAADIAVTAASQGDVANSCVRDLAAALQRVDEITNSITAIARRTHLLALNAKIEAQRAGDAGRGFAVVAAEVNDLAQQTAQATDQVRAIVTGINDSSERASTTIADMTATMSKICESTASIAGAVTQQTATTREIGRASESAANGAADISGRVSSVHDRARDVAYTGAQKDAARSEELRRIETALRETIQGLDTGDFQAVIDNGQEVVDQAARNIEGTKSVGNVTTVLDYVLGTGLNEFEYTGAWLHGNGYETDIGGDAYCSVAGDQVKIRFNGKQIRFFGSVDKQQGMAEVSIDNQSPDLVDFYSPTRAAHTMLWTSPELALGEHVFRLVVSPKKDPQSRYFWASVAKVEIVH